MQGYLARCSVQWWNTFLTKIWKAEQRTLLCPRAAEGLGEQLVFLLPPLHSQRRNLPSAVPPHGCSCRMKGTSAGVESAASAQNLPGAAGKYSI